MEKFAVKSLSLTHSAHHQFRQFPAHASQLGIDETATWTDHTPYHSFIFYFIHFFDSQLTPLLSP